MTWRRVGARRAAAGRVGGNACARWRRMPHRSARSCSEAVRGHSCRHSRSIDGPARRRRGSGFRASFATALLHRAPPAAWSNPSTCGEGSRRKGQSRGALSHDCGAGSCLPHELGHVRKQRVAQLHPSKAIAKPILGLRRPPDLCTEGRGQFMRLDISSTGRLGDGLRHEHLRRQTRANGPGGRHGATLACR